MNKYLEILVGLFLIGVSAYVALPPTLGGVFGIIWASVKTVLIGGITIGVFLVGLLFLMLGVMDLRG
jgi:hypothetical protein